MTPSGASGGSVPRHLLRIGGMEVRRVIGRGGMGTVYEAWNPTSSQIAAVKVLADHVSASPQAVTRFQREAQAASQLHHPNITQIFAQGEDEGIHYYAMELVDGTSLHQIITAARSRKEHLSDPAETVLLPRKSPDGKSTPSSPDKSGAVVEPATSAATVAAIEHAIRLTAGECSNFERSAFIAGHLAAVADALQHAHDAGVIHRDIKPHNLLMGSDGRIRVTDFGLARLMAEPGVTVTGEMIGSPLYMSAEQVSGGPANVDHRTDVYSLGATMYEWLTLRPPFPGESREQVITRLLQGDAPSLRQTEPSIPTDLETICLKALERDRRFRYASAAEFRDDLRRFLDGKRIKARRAGIRARLRRSMRRHQLRWIAGSDAVLTMILLGGLWRTGRQAQKQSELAEQATAKASAVAEDADQLLRSVRQVFREQLPLEISGPVRILEAGLPVVKGLVETEEGTTEDAAPAVAEGAEPANVDTPAGIARTMVDDLYGAVAEKAPADGDDLAKVMRMAEDLRRDEPAKALNQVETYLQIRPHDPRALRLRAALNLQRGRLAEAKADIERLMSGESALPDAAEAHLWRGLVRFLTNDIDAAASDFEQAPTSPALSHWTVVAKSLVQLQEAKLDEAITVLGDVLREHPDFVPALLARATALSGKKEFTAAVADLSHVIELEPDNADAYAARGDFYSNVPDYAAAAADYQHAIALGGPSTAMNLRWLMARMAINREPEPGDRSSQAPADAGQPDVPAEIWSDHMQEWFSQRVWPPASGAASPPSGVAPQPMAPRPPTSETVPPS